MKLDKIPSDHLLLSGSKLQVQFKYTEPLCDFIIFINVSKGPVKVIAIELKSGTVDESEFNRAHKQLLNGAALANKIAGSTQVASFDTYIVKTNMNSFAARMLKNDKYRINFRTLRTQIKSLHCGDYLPSN